MKGSLSQVCHVNFRNDKTRPTSFNFGSRYVEDDSYRTEIGAQRPFFMHAVGCVDVAGTCRGSYVDVRLS